MGVKWRCNMPRNKRPRFQVFISDYSHRELAKKAVSMETIIKKLKANNSDLKKHVQYLALELAMRDLEEQTEEGPDED